MDASSSPAPSASVARAPTSGFCGCSATARPDPSFGGGDGLATIPVDDGFDSAGALAVQPDGRIVVVGTGGNGSGGLAVAVARLQTGGQADPSFSGDGLTVVDAGPFLYTADAVAIAADGSIAVGAGGLKSPLSSFGDLTAIKLEADGDPVAGFGDGGVAKLDFGYGEAATDVLVGPAGTITLPGSLCTGGTHGNCGGIVGRLLADGSPDPSFGDAGRVRPTLRSRDAAELLADGRTIIGGAERLGKPTGSDFTLERLTADGGEDTGFSDDGVVRTDFDFEEDAGADLALSPGGGAVVAGSSGSGLALARYELGPGPSDADADGVLDDRDRCPERFSERPSGCPKVERALEVLVPANDRLAGRITSPTGACIAKQKVKVKRRVRHGPDRTVGHASTNARGEWRAHKRLGHGRFRAVAKRSIDPIAGRCNRARSRTVHA